MDPHRIDVVPDIAFTLCDHVHSQSRSLDMPVRRQLVWTHHIEEASETDRFPAFFMERWDDNCLIGNVERGLDCYQLQLGGGWLFVTRKFIAVVNRIWKYRKTFFNKIPHVFKNEAQGYCFLMVARCKATHPRLWWNGPKPGTHPHEISQLEKLFMKRSPWGTNFSIVFWGGELIIVTISSFCLADTCPGCRSHAISHDGAGGIQSILKYWNAILNNLI